MKTGQNTSWRLDKEMDWPTIYLKQGEYYISEGEPALVRTILGSCVTVTLFCPVRKIGGITHSLLPFPLPGTTVAPGHDGRFVDSSIRKVFEKMGARKIVRKQLEVKIFGGGQMLLPDTKSNTHTPINIGRRNVETALQTIQELGLNVTATDVGGTWGRKLIFFPHRGDVWVKKIHRRVNQTGVSHD